MKDQIFLGNYTEAVEFNLDDPDFDSLIRSKHFDPEEIAFSLNWDLILAQVLQAPIVTSRGFAPVIQYKINETIDHIARHTNLSKRAFVLRRFLSRLNLLFPQDLDPDVLIELRKEKPARKFRSWFGKEIERAMIASKVADVELDEALYRSFTELLSQQRQNRNRMATVLTGFLAGTVGLFTHGIGALPVTALGAFAFPRIVTSLWKKMGPTNWVLILSDTAQQAAR